MTITPFPRTWLVQILTFPTYRTARRSSLSTTSPPMAYNHLRRHYEASNITFLCLFVANNGLTVSILALLRNADTTVITCFWKISRNIYFKIWKFGKHTQVKLHSKFRKFWKCEREFSTKTPVDSFMFDAHNVVIGIIKSATENILPFPANNRRSPS